MYFTFITGATGVLGRSFCLDCAVRGENLFLTGRSQSKLNELQAYLQSVNKNIKIVTCPCDLTCENSRANLFAQASVYVFDRVINCSGVDVQKPIAEFTQEELNFLVRATFEGVAAVCLFAISHRAEYIKVINISSVSGIFPMPYFALYSASKSALTHFTVALNGELGKSGRATAILPGAIYTRTDVIEYIGMQGAWGKIAAKTPEYVVKKSRWASERGKLKYVVGSANRFLNGFSALLPLRWRNAFIAKKWSKMRKDGFFTKEEVHE